MPEIKPLIRSAGDRRTQIPWILSHLPETPGATRLVDLSGKGGTLLMNAPRHDEEILRAGVSITPLLRAVRDVPDQLVDAVKSAPQDQRGYFAESCRVARLDESGDEVEAVSVRYAMAVTVDEDNVFKQGVRSTAAEEGRIRAASRRLDGVKITDLSLEDVYFAWEGPGVTILLDLPDELRGEPGRTPTPRLAKLLRALCKTKSCVLLATSDGCDLTARLPGWWRAVGGGGLDVFCNREIKGAYEIVLG